MGKISRREIKFVLLISSLLIIITSLPFFYGYLVRGIDYYLGTQYINGIDGSVYLSYIAQVKDGNFLLENLFTNEIPGEISFNPFWLIIGLFARVFNLAPIISFHLARIFLIPIFLLILYKVIIFFLGETDLKIKKLGFLFAIFASGLGAYIMFFWPPGPTLLDQVNIPMDVWVSEGFNFLILLSSPHLLASLSLLILALYFFFLAIENNSCRHSVLAGLAALALFSFHPYHVLPIYSVPLIYLAIKIIRQRSGIWQYLRHYLILLAISWPPVLYFLYLSLFNASFKNKALQNICLTPPVFNFFISYGLLFLLAVFTMVYLTDKKSWTDKYIFLAVWFFAAIFLMHAPLIYQRRLAEGFQIPLIILAYQGLLIIYRSLKNQEPTFKPAKLKAILLVFFLLFGFSNFYAYLNSFMYLHSENQLVYIPQDLAKALFWYRQSSTIEQTMMTDSHPGNIIPGMIKRRVFLGHPVETNNFHYKYGQVIWFFQSNGNDQAKKDFLKTNRIDYILYSAAEKKLGEFKPQEKDYLKEVYKNKQASIYQVI